jgi:hypothetical protein
LCLFQEFIWNVCVLITVGRERICELKDSQVASTDDGWGFPKQFTVPALDPLLVWPDRPIVTVMRVDPGEEIVPALPDLMMKPWQQLAALRKKVWQPDQFVEVWLNSKFTNRCVQCSEIDMKQWSQSSEEGQ